MMALHLRRSGALLVSAALLASLTTALVAAPVTAAWPTCAGKVATIVGTQGDDVLYGTSGRDIIAGLGGDDIIRGYGGNDLICGGRGADRVAGHSGLDRLYGNAGSDQLLGGKGPDHLLGGVGDDVLKGQVGDDHLDGGPGTDFCHQGEGSVPMVRCEPGPRRLLRSPQILAVAYSDMNHDHVYDTNDVLIAQLVDTDHDKVPSAGDTIRMGRYPTRVHFGRSTFECWGVNSHRVAEAVWYVRDSVIVRTTSGGYHSWSRMSEQGCGRGTGCACFFDGYSESTSFANGWRSAITDTTISTPPYDSIALHPWSPSQPKQQLLRSRSDALDDRLIDVEITYAASCTHPSQ